MNREPFAEEVARRIGEPYDQIMYHGAGLLISGMEGTNTLYVANDKPGDSTFVECQYPFIRERRILFGRNKAPGARTYRTIATTMAGGLGIVTIVGYESPSLTTFTINGQPGHMHSEPGEPCE